MPLLLLRLLLMPSLLVPCCCCCRHPGAAPAVAGHSGIHVGDAFDRWPGLCSITFLLLFLNCCSSPPQITLLLPLPVMLLLPCSWHPAAMLMLPPLLLLLLLQVILGLVVVPPVIAGLTYILHVSGLAVRVCLCPAVLFDKPITLPGSRACHNRNVQLGIQITGMSVRAAVLQKVADVAIDMPRLHSTHALCPAPQVGGPYLALYLWAFLLLVSLFFMSIYPTLIAPLFNKYDPLPEVSPQGCQVGLAWQWPVQVGHGTPGTPSACVPHLS